MENHFILTDHCMWEANKKKGARSPHAVQVVDEKTGQVRYIKTGSRVKFISGEITDTASQELYNSQNEKIT